MQSTNSKRVQTLKRVIVALIRLMKGVSNNYTTGYEDKERLMSGTTGMLSL